MATETHKGRKSWYVWHGTPGAIAAIAREAGIRVGSPSAGAVKIKIDSPAWESNYESVEDFEEGIRTSDLPDVRVVEIEAAADAARRITVTLTWRAGGGGVTTSQDQRKPVAELYVAGEDRSWVSETTDAMTELIPSTTPSNRGIRLTLWGGLLLVVSGVILFGSVDSSPVHGIGVGIAITGGAFLLLGLLGAMVVPVFELLPDGGVPRRRRIGRRLRAEGTWLVREALAGMMGFLLGIGATLLWQRLF